ncbi:uncharacterized protein yc1106_09547 [Curvularia clavata]|uniref:Uncharacterized protein n=1 Tax=Curvularia clavata TaxID=95742 RepID=A0A9Q8ZKC6_CURCL|nr:uncharacterized protein yc1106_09547 [Curvularia clavata]
MATKDTIMHPVPEPEHQPTDPSVESADCSSHETERPKTSPYASPIVELMVGPENKAYHVPYDLLPNSHFTAFICPGSAIYLPDLDEDTGHVLAHYLYTGTYQTLDCMVTSENEELQIEFKRAVLAYVAARSLGLDGLEQLAKNKVEDFGAKMSIIDIVEAIQKDFSRIPIDATWFHEYFDLRADESFDVKKRTDAAFELNRRENDTVQDELALLAMINLFHRIENIALFRALAKPLLRTYHQLYLALIEHSENIGKSRETTRSQVSHTEETTGEGCAAAEGSLIEAHIETKPIEDILTPEGVVEERDFAAEPDTQAEERRENTYDEGTVALDIDGKESELTPQIENVSLPHPKPEPVPAEQSTNDPRSDWGHGNWGHSDWGRSDWGRSDWGRLASKKKKSKKAPVPDAVPSPPHEISATEPPSQLEQTYEDVQKEEALQDHGSPTFKDDGKDPEDIPPVSTSNVEAEPENKESVGWPSTSIWDGSKKKKKSKKIRALEPEPEPVQEPPIDDPVPVKELGNAEVDDEKLDNGPTRYQVVPEGMESVQNPPTTEIIEETVSVPVEKPQVDNPWGILLPIKLKKSKKKKGLRAAQKGVESESAKPIETTANTRLSEESQSMPTKSADLNNGNTEVYPEGEVCPWFNEHSQPGGQWETCQRCKNYVLRVALDQFHRSISNGVEVS